MATLWVHLAKSLPIPWAGLAETGRYNNTDYSIIKMSVGTMLNIANTNTTLGVKMADGAMTNLLLLTKRQE